MDGLYKRSKFQLNRMKTDELLRVKVSDIPYQLWTARLSLMRPLPIGMKLVPDERSGPMTPWGQMPKISYRPFFELWPLKVDICKCFTPNDLLTQSPNCFMFYGTRTMFDASFSSIGEGHL